MTSEKLEELFNKVMSEDFCVLQGKGIEYSGKGDRLANFKKLGEELGLDPRVILWVYLRKHIDSIASYIKNGRVNSNEGIEGRIMDARNYLLLLRALIEEVKLTPYLRAKIDDDSMSE